MSSWLSVVFTWLSSELLTRLGFLLALVFVANLLGQRRSPSSTIAWLLVILLEPYLGVPLYVIFGGRKMNPLARKKARIYRKSPDDRERSSGVGTERLLASYGVPPARHGNRSELVSDGIEAYRKILGMIEDARSTIHITTYILGWDEGSRAILEALRRRALAGVAVRLLIDDLGSWRLRRRHLSRLIDAGVQVAFFMPVLHVPLRGRANLRNHRKLIVIDGRIALTGGINLAFPYLGPPGTTELWKDLAVIVEGPAVPDMEEIFSSDWRFTTGTEPGTSAAPSVPGPLPSATSDTMQVVASGPDVAGDPLYESLLALIFSADKRIWIVTPYFVPDEMLARAINLAARRGVDVRLIVPARSNHISADLARAGYLRDLHNAGGKVLLHAPVMLHAKVVIFDDDLAIIGSANMDMRSLFLNYELALFLRSPSQVQEIASWARGLMVDSHRELPTPDWPRELAENVVRLISPLL
ncbi:MAG: cardiolipin synthase [Isosphaeraceae bacterium]